MRPGRWQDVKELFAAALDRPTPERAAFVDSVDVEDESVREEVRRLLKLHDESPEFLSTPFDSHADPLIGRRLGGFLIERRIGAGGMGAVYEAVQEHPHRRAAVKVLRPDFATSSMLRRFEFESQVLAKLQHPGIAHVYAAGTFDLSDGAQPWFAMELIEGRPLGEYVAQERSPTRRRLELLALICDAVQHAHQRSVIHRDLKPANILVDGSGQPKVLDFGVARAIDADVQLSLHTSVGELVGTLSYMSPEQLSSSQGADVDVRCDVYALGVIGYELVSGTLPHVRRSGSVTDMIRAIEQETPQRLGRINPALRGDVETIFAKALEKDPDRRYQSASDLAADIRRWLNHEPVLARPATVGYRLRKFIRRNRALVGGALATVLVLIAGIIMYAVEARNARIEAARARSEASRARYEADKATAINNFMTNDFMMKVLAASRDGNGEGQKPSVEKLVDEAAANIGTMFAGQPLAEAAVRNEVATIYYNLGAIEPAAAQFKLALDLWESKLGADHADTLKAVNNLGQTFMRMRRPADAEPLYRRALDGRRRILGEDDPFTLVSMNNLAELLRSAGKLDEAEALFRRALDVQRRVHGPAHKNTITTAANLGSLLVRRGKIDEALQLHREAFEASRSTLGDDHITTLTAGLRLGQTLHRAGALEQSADVLQDLVGRSGKALGDDHPNTINARRALSRVYESQGKRLDAVGQLRAALAAAESKPQALSELAREIEAELTKLDRSPATLPTTSPTTSASSTR